jgi:Rps23 Pro-64 3,4-dihydroxylase Tpa1-like proline 4-hydroxylase
MRRNYYKPNILGKKLRYLRHKLTPFISRDDRYFDIDNSLIWKCNLNKDNLPYDPDKLEVKDPHKYIKHNQYEIIDNALPEDLNKCIYNLFTNSSFQKTFKETNQNNRSCQISFDKSKDIEEFKLELSKSIWLKTSEVLSSLPPYMEVQFTRSGAWDFFGPHIDPGCNQNEFLTGRKITFVYYVQQEPKKYKSGELNLWLSSKDTKVIEPVNNRLVIMYPWTHHLITRTKCKHLWDHGRFTVNGWFWDEWRKDGLYNPVDSLRNNNDDK